jgi:hypothetical protein
MNPKHDYRSQAANKILGDEDEGDPEEEDPGKTLLESLDETEFPVAEHPEPEDFENYRRSKTPYEDGE